MRVEQISVFLENRAGRLAEVTGALARADINIRALSLADTPDFGILRLILTDTERACALLREKGFTVGRNEVAAIRMADCPGGLDAILRLLNGSGINVEYMYAFAHGEKDAATLVCRFDDMDGALAILTAGGVPLISQAQLDDGARQER